MADDLATVTERAMACARKWDKLCEGHERRSQLRRKIEGMWSNNTGDAKIAGDQI